jgi:hypothetical protein
MSDEKLKRLLVDLIECDPGYRQAREAARVATRVSATALAPVRRRSWWRPMAIAASLVLVLGLVGVLLKRHQPTTRIAGRAAEPKATASPFVGDYATARPLVEIVSTADLPAPLVEIDHSDLHVLFPNGVFIAYSKTPVVFTFEASAAPARPF